MITIVTLEQQKGILNARKQQRSKCLSVKKEKKKETIFAEHHWLLFFCFLLHLLTRSRQALRSASRSLATCFLSSATSAGSTGGKSLFFSSCFCFSLQAFTATPRIANTTVNTMMTITHQTSKRYFGPKICLKSL